METKDDAKSKIPAWAKACNTYCERISGSRRKRCAVFVASSDSSCFDLFLSHLLPDDRRQHKCNSCQHFFQNAARLVVVGCRTGKIRSLVWPGESDEEFKAVPEVYKAANLALKKEIEGKNTVLGPSSYTVANTLIGTQQCGGFYHMYLILPSNLSFHHENRQILTHHHMLERCCQDYTIEQLDKVLEWFACEELPERTHAEPAIKWMKEILVNCHIPGETVGNPS